MTNRVAVLHFDGKHMADILVAAGVPPPSKLVLLITRLGRREVFREVFRELSSLVYATIGIIDIRELIDSNVFTYFGS